MGYLILKDYFLNRLNNARGKLWLLIAAVLTLISLVLHLGFLWQPSETVFDEVHFGRFASAYFTGAYYFDIHPPLGKLLIALGAFLGGYLQYVQDYGVFDFENIGEPYGQAPFVWFRVLPALAGSLIPLAVFCFARSLGLNQRASLLVMFGLVFENALLAHTRLALLDAFLLVFGFAGLALFFFARNHGYSLWPLLLAGFSLSLSFSTKWTGLSFFGLAGLVMFYDFVKGRRKQVNSSRSVFLAKFFLVMVAVPLAVYYSVFVAHFRLLPDNGPGMPYMTSDFRQGKLSLPQKFIELNQKMGFYNATLKASHSYGSPAWTWPGLTRPIFYWHKQVGPGLTSRIYLLANPLVWWAATLGALAFFIWRKSFGSLSNLGKSVLAIGYLANFLPFFSVTRVLFLYHYFAAFIFSLIMLSLVLDQGVLPKLGKRAWIGQAIWVAAVLGLFCFFAPLSFGLPLTEAGYKWHIWLPSWI